MRTRIILILICLFVPITSWAGVDFTLSSPAGAVLVKVEALVTKHMFAIRNGTNLSTAQQAIDAIGRLKETERQQLKQLEVMLHSYILLMKGSKFDEALEKIDEIKKEVEWMSSPIMLTEFNQENLNQLWYLWEDSKSRLSDDVVADLAQVEAKIRMLANALAEENNGEVDLVLDTLPIAIDEIKDKKLQDNMMFLVRDIKSMRSAEDKKKEFMWLLKDFIKISRGNVGSTFYGGSMVVR